MSGLRSVRAKGVKEEDNVDCFVHMPSLAYLRFGNVFTGSRGAFNFKLFPNTDEQTVRMVVWTGRNCLDASEPQGEKTVALTESGWQEGKAWICAQGERLCKPQEDVSTQEEVS